MTGFAPLTAPRQPGRLMDALRSHWPEYLIEAVGLGLFMVSAAAFGVLLFHPGAATVRALPDPLPRRVLMGLAMGATAVALIRSPWGARSGAHFNPATTLTFWRLGKVAAPDALWYAAAQVVGGLLGILAAAALLGPALADPAVDYVATVPGLGGRVAAFAAEIAIAFVLMTVVLHASNHPRLAALTPYLVGALITAYIALESPISGMSMNPARSLASAVPAGTWAPLWIYLLAPPLGMLLAAETYARRRGLAAVRCAKLHHDAVQPCIFDCRYRELGASTPAR